MNNPYLNLSKLSKLLNKEAPLDIRVSFIDGPKVELFGGKKNEWYCVMFTDAKTGERQHLHNMQANHWTKALRSYYTDWLIEIYDSEQKIYEHRFDLADQVVYIALDSKALGDTIAWFPYIEEFRKKHKCKVICSTFHNYLFEKEYKELVFVNPGHPVNGIYAMYKVGWFGPSHNKHRNINDCRTSSLQKICSEYLGMEDVEIKPKVVKNTHQKKKEISIGPESTTKAKLWNHSNGWQEVVSYYRAKGYIVNCIASDDTDLKGVYQLDHGRRTIEEAIKLLQQSEIFIGLGSGLSWLAWALDVPVVMISGFSEPWCEFKNPYRIIKDDVCCGCFNDIKYEFDKGDWDWCPRKKNFECSTSIPSAKVINMANMALIGV